MEKDVKKRISNFLEHAIRSNDIGSVNEPVYAVKGKLTEAFYEARVVFSFAFVAEDGKRYKGTLMPNSSLLNVVNKYSVNKEFVFIFSNHPPLIHLYFAVAFSEELFGVCKEVCAERNEKVVDVSKAYFDSIVFDEETEEKISDLPEEIKGKVRKQLCGKTFPVNSGAKKKPYTRDTLMKFYDVCKHTYPLPTQQRLDELFAGTIKDNKDILRLILSVSTGYLPEQVTPDEIETELNKKILFRESEINSVINVVNSNQIRGKGTRLLFIGPEGCGKSTLAYEFAKARKKPYINIPFYTYSNLVDFSGCSSVFDSSQAGSFYKKLLAAGTTDVTCIVEKIDEATHGDKKNGDPDAGLLSVLRNSYYDTFLEAEFDTSMMDIICYAEDENKVAANLKDCFDAIVYFSGYTNAERFTIAKERIVPEIIASLPETVASDIYIDDDTIRYVIKNFCHDSGLRILTDSLNTLVMKIIEKGSNLLTHSQIDRFLDMENLNKNAIATIHMNKEFFDPESYKIIEQMISAGKASEEGAKTDLAKKQIDYIHKIIRPVTGEKFTFDFKDFMPKVNKTHDGMNDVKMAYARQFNRLARTGKGGNLLIVSPPGQGKTTLGKSSSEAAGLPFFKISCNAVTDPSFFKGTSSAVNLGSPGIITKALSVTGRRAVIMLDEIDKLNASSAAGYAVVSALLDLLDERRYADIFLDGVRIDLSQCIIVATANYVENIPAEICNRFEMVTMNPFSSKQKINILRNYIIPSLLEENNCVGNVSFTEDALEFLVRNYPTSTGARQIRVMASKIIETELLTSESFEVTVDDVIRIIGIPAKGKSVKNVEYVPGRVNGIGVNMYTGTGSISVIDCISVGEDGAKVTGMVKGSCLESVEVAKAAAATINSDCEKANYHIHFGSGEAAVTKDGPSAGVAMVMAMLSCQYGKAVDAACAFTGEVDVRANVYAVGGVPQKIRGAIECGCKKIYIPEQNYLELKEDELAEFSAEAEVISVKTIADILDDVMPDTKIAKLAS